MMAVPVNFHDRQYSVFLLIIEKENLDRMKQADPITLEAVSRGGQVLSQIAYPANCSIIVAYEEDDTELYRLVRAGDALALVKYVLRGERFDPASDGPEHLIHFKAMDA